MVGQYSRLIENCPQERDETWKLEQTLRFSWTEFIPTNFFLPVFPQKY